MSGNVNAAKGWLRSKFGPIQSDDNFYGLTRSKIIRLTCEKFGITESDCSYILSEFISDEIIREEGEEKIIKINALGNAHFMDWVNCLFYEDWEDRNNGTSTSG